MSIVIPPALHEVLGTRQTRLSLITIGSTILGAFVLLGPEVLATNQVALWRRGLALVLLLDIAAGAVANLTAGTSAFYAQSPRRRWVFIAVHVHFPVFAALLGLPLWPAVLVWAYTVGAASVLNLLFAHPEQRVLAGMVLTLGVMGLAALELGPLGTAVAALFMLKVCYAFAVNHGEAPR